MTAPTTAGHHSIITDTFATPASVHASIVYLGRLHRQVERFGFQVGAVGLDAGLRHARHRQETGGTRRQGVTGYPDPTPNKAGVMRRSALAYDEQADACRCPRGQLLAYATTDRTGYRYYRSDRAICRDCPLRAPAPGAPTMPTAPQPGARRSTAAARRRWSAPSQTPSTRTATAMPASESSPAHASGACSQPQPTTSRRWPSASRRSAKPPSPEPQQPPCPTATSRHNTLTPKTKATSEP